MRVTKTVTTRYTVDFGNDKKTPTAIAGAINKLDGAGVDLVDAELEMGEYKKFYITTIRERYYDDSTLNRIEA